MLLNRRKREKDLPHVYNSRIYLGKIPQTGSGAISNILATLLANVGNVIGMSWLEKNIK